MSGAPSPLPLVADGEILNAEISCTEHTHNIDLIIESRSGRRGSDRERNPDYLPALTVLLEGLSALGARIEDLQIVSQPALKLPEYERRLPFEYPILLSSKTNFVALRTRITQAQRGVARGVKASGNAGGNNNKRLMLRVARNDGIPSARTLIEALAHN
jgi:hypothetical protein